MLNRYRTGYVATVEEGADLTVAISPEGDWEVYYRPSDAAIEVARDTDLDFSIAGLVYSEKIGRVRTCTIAPEALREAERWINARRIEWERRLDRLGKYLETLETEGETDGSGNRSDT
jgi:hypothetical protein